MSYKTRTMKKLHCSSPHILLPPARLPTIQQPLLQHLVGVGEVLDPLLDLLLEGCIVAVGEQGAEDHEAVLHLVDRLRGCVATE